MKPGETGDEKMKNLYIKNDKIELSNGIVIVTNKQAVEAAKQGRVTPGVRKEMRRYGQGPALGEEIAVHQA